MGIRTYFVADGSVGGVVYLTGWRKFSQRFLKRRVLMLCCSKMREHIRILVLQPMCYFVDVNFRCEWMDNYGLSFCHLIPFNLHHILSSYGDKNAEVYVKIYSRAFAKLAVRTYVVAATFTLVILKNV